MWSVAEAACRSSSGSRQQQCQCTGVLIGSLHSASMHAIHVLSGLVISSASVGVLCCRVVLPVEDKPSQTLKEAILAGGKQVCTAAAGNCSSSNTAAAPSSSRSCNSLQACRPVWPANAGVNVQAAAPPLTPAQLAVSSLQWHTASSWTDGCRNSLLCLGSLHALTILLVGDTRI